VAVALTAGGNAVVKNKSRRLRAHRIDDVGACRDVAERLRQRALDHIDAVQGAFTRGDAGTG
jgi:hypothetical protein